MQRTWNCLQFCDKELLLHDVDRAAQLVNLMYIVCHCLLAESQATMLSIGATESIFGSKDSGIMTVTEQKESEATAILEVNYWIHSSYNAYTTPTCALYIM